LIHFYKRPDYFRFKRHYIRSIPTLLQIKQYKHEESS